MKNKKYLVLFNNMTSSPISKPCIKFCKRRKRNKKKNNNPSDSNSNTLNNESIASIALAAATAANETISLIGSAPNLSVKDSAAIGAAAAIGIATGSDISIINGLIKNSTIIIDNTSLLTTNLETVVVAATDAAVSSLGNNTLLNVNNLENIINLAAVAGVDAVIASGAMLDANGPLAGGAAAGAVAVAVFLSGANKDTVIEIATQAAIDNGGIMAAIAANAAADAIFS